MSLPEADYTEFFTVQDEADAERLRGPGEPWPTTPERAAVGEGVYAWAHRVEAEAYQAYLLLIEDEPLQVEILKFRVHTTVLQSFRQVNVDALGPEGSLVWMSRYSQLWDGTPDHDLEYVQRGTNFGVEHFFHKSVFHLLHFVE